MKIWSELASQALIGSGRNAATVVLPEPLSCLLEGSEGEDRLLRAAGVLATADAAARKLPASSGAIPEPAPEESLTPLSEAGILSLAGRILDDANEGLVNEMADMMAARGRVLPAAMLPRALFLGRKKPSLRDAVRKILGRRGAWLASFNSDWSYAQSAGLEPLDDRLWDEGGTQERVQFLTHLREGDPARARQLLESCFVQETARNRVSLLGAMAVNPEISDEPFLAGLLQTDRSRDVRQLAAKILSRLPESALARRMVGILRSSIRLERDDSGQAKLLIDLPMEFDPAWKADTLEEHAPASPKIGARAWWLLQIISLAPLNWWEDHLVLPPEEICSLIAKSGWSVAMIRGLSLALDSQPGHPAWTLAVYKLGEISRQSAVDLALALPAEQAETMLAHILAHTDETAVLNRIVEAANSPWSEALWRVALKKLLKRLSTDDWALAAALPAWACRMPATLLAEEIPWPEAPYFAEAIINFTRIIHQRRSLHQLLP